MEIIMLDPGNRRVCDACNTLLTENGEVLINCVLSRNSLYCEDCFYKIHENAKKYNEERFFPQTKTYLPGDNVSGEDWYLGGEL